MTITIFICANEHSNAGERDYMLALAKTIGTNPNCVAFKLSQTHTGNAAPLPQSKQAYATLPALTGTALDALLKLKPSHINIVATGASTLLEARKAIGYLRGKVNTTAHYITHKVDTAEDLAALVRENITLISPLDREILSGIDAANAEYVNLDYIQAMPHTNTNISCATEFQDLMAQQRAQKTLLPQIIDEKLPFTFAVLNAGYKKDGKTHTPYTANEAYHDGAMLASRLPVATHLVLADGGPRNGFDIAAGHNTRARFAQGFADAQEIMGYYSPLIATLPFEHDPASPNAVKAGLHMGKMKNCMAFVSNAEGFGTMDSAIRHINNQKRPLMAFPFAAQDDDTTHQANIAKYNAQGITLMHARTGDVTKGTGQTPVAPVNSAQDIVNILGLKPSLTPRLGLTPRNTYSS